MKELGFGKVLDNIAEEVNLAIDKAVKETREELDKDFDKKKKELEKLGAKLPVKYIKEGKKRGVIVEGLTHKRFDFLLDVLSIEENAMIVGPAGSGKTQACEMVAKALGLEFYAISVGAQTSKSDLLGFINANGDYVETAFRKAYEKGGVFLMDEIDAGNANVLIVLNSALSNGYCGFADKMVKKHKDFRFVASANTYGSGADRMYVGRNQLDSATLDRFVIIDWDYDENIEKELVDGYLYGEKWRKYIMEVRKSVAKNKIRAVISTRAIIKGVKLLELGINSEEVIKSVIYGGMNADGIKVVENIEFDGSLGIEKVEEERIDFGF